MPVSLLKNILTLREDPPPKTLLVSDVVGVSGLKIVDHLVKQFQLKHYTIHYVLASSFSRARVTIEDNPDIHYHLSNYELYGDDGSPLETALDQILKSSNISPSPHIPRLTLLNAAATKCSVTASVGGNTTCGSCNTPANGRSRNTHTACSSAKGGSVASGSNGSVTGEDGRAVKQNRNHLLVVDKVEDLLLYISCRLMLGAIRDVTDAGCCSVLLWCGRDVISTSAYTSLCHGTDAAITLETPGVQHWHATASVSHSKPSGKYLHSRERYNIDDQTGAVSTQVVPEEDGLLSNYTNTDSSFTTTAANTPTSYTSDAISKSSNGSATTGGDHADAIIRTTFNLSLSDEERKSKNSLQLPHTRAMQAVGLVNYTMDREDWDDEDPDDDLDI